MTCAFNDQNKNKKFNAGKSMRNAVKAMYFYMVWKGMENMVQCEDVIKQKLGFDSVIICNNRH